MEPLPRHLSVPRPMQQEAVDQIVEHFDRGTRVVVLNGPTGSGKTLIGEMVRRAMKVRGIYACTTIGLQNQFLTDFTYGRLLKGRANYPTEHRADKTAEDCMGREVCFLCDAWRSCPYQIARREAMGADLAVVNTSYWLHEVNLGGGNFGYDKRLNVPQDFIIFDEADELESSLMGFVEFRSWGSRRLGMQFYAEPPKKGARIPTIINWLTEYTRAIEQWAKTRSEIRDLNSASGHIGEVMKLQGELQAEMERAGDRDEDEKYERVWVRDYSYDDRLTYKPVKVDLFGQRMLWRHSKQFLLMSATMIAPRYRMQTLGWDEDEHGEIAVVDMPMQFPVANRPIYMCPVAKMNFKQRDEEFPRLVAGIVTIAERNPGVRILVHTVSYKLTSDLRVALRRELPRRMVVSYTKSAERDEAMRKYSEIDNAIMLAPSMGRGFDFKDDLARVVVIIKVPYASIGDRQVSSRLHSSDGRMWYDVSAVSEIVQMTGRGVRSAEDHCETWILDADFPAKLWKERKDLFPRWWREAVETMPPRALITKKVG